MEYVTPSPSRSVPRRNSNCLRFSLRRPRLLDPITLVLYSVKRSVLCFWLVPPPPIPRIAFSIAANCLLNLSSPWRNTLWANIYTGNASVVPSYRPQLSSPLHPVSPKGKILGREFLPFPPASPSLFDYCPDQLRGPDRSPIGFKHFWSFCTDLLRRQPNVESPSPPRQDPGSHPQRDRCTRGRNSFKITDGRFGDKIGDVAQRSGF